MSDLRRTPVAPQIGTSLSAYGTARSTIEGEPLSRDELEEHRSVLGG